MKKQKIIENKAKCLLCGDIVESTHRHDFVKCCCGNIAVDGGHEYLRRVYKDADTIQDLSVTEEVEHEDKYGLFGEENK